MASPTRLDATAKDFLRRLHGLLAADAPREVVVENADAASWWLDFLVLRHGAAHRISLECVWEDSHPLLQGRPNVAVVAQPYRGARPAPGEIEKAWGDKAALLRGDTPFLMFQADTLANTWATAQTTPTETSGATAAAAASKPPRRRRPPTSAPR